MDYRKFPRTEFEVSAIAFGCMSLDGNDAENARLIHEANDRGINFFDTADLYDKGENERTVGKALKDRREQVILATKVGNQWRADGSGWDWNPRKKYILEAVDKSLARLQTDYIDLYQLHGGTIDDPIDEVIETFELLKDAGKIRYYGISSIRPNVIREYMERAQILSNMLQYSLLDRRPEEEVLSLLQKKGVGVIVRGAIARGIFIKNDRSNYLSYSKQLIDLVTDKLRVLSIDKTPVQVAIQWVLANPAVTTIAAGIRTKAQLDDWLGALEVPPITESEVQMLSELLTPNKYENHR